MNMTLYLKTSHKLVTFTLMQVFTLNMYMLNCSTVKSRYNYILPLSIRYPTNSCLYLMNSSRVSQYTVISVFWINMSPTVRYGTCRFNLKLYRCIDKINSGLTQSIYIVFLINYIKQLPQIKQTSRLTNSTIIFADMIYVFMYYVRSRDDQNGYTKP